MRTTLALSLFLACLFLCQSCRMAEVLTGDEKAGTVDTLWPDVPQMDGTKKADLAIPLAARLFIRTAMQGKVNFISYTTTHTARDVKDFYTDARMRSAGWKVGESGCISDSDNQDSTGLMCLYNRKNGSKDEGLAIVVAEDTKNHETHIFYARIDTTPDDTNKASAKP